MFRSHSRSPFAHNMRLKERNNTGTGPEQALAINLANKGIILIVGCGHQTLSRIVKRAQALFKLPIYGVIGDLHYPLPNGRIEMLGVNIQHRFASGSSVFSPLEQEDIDADFDLLDSQQLGVLALGGHDTSDEVINRAATQFKSVYKFIRVGERIEL